MPQRKHNRLTYYDYHQNGCYFITLCTHDRARLFSVENAEIPSSTNDTFSSDAPLSNRIVHKWLFEVQKKYKYFHIDIYVIMPDHIHILATLTQQNMGRSIPEIMAFFKTMTTNAYIRAVKAGSLPQFDKKIWQKSYYDHVVRNQQDYDETWTYIENNPIKWKMTRET